MKAGSKVEFVDLQKGMKIRVILDAGALGAKSGITAIEGIVYRREAKQVVAGYHEDLDTVYAEDHFMLGTERDTFTLLEDFNEPKLPEREGPVIASWRKSQSGFVKSAGENTLGRWGRTDGGFKFFPIGSLFGVSSFRVTAITEVTPVPDDALEILADLQHRLTGVTVPSIHTTADLKDGLGKFFRRLNEVQS